MEEDRVERDSAELPVTLLWGAVLLIVLWGGLIELIRSVV